MLTLRTSNFLRGQLSLRNPPLSQRRVDALSPRCWTASRRPRATGTSASRRWPGSTSTTSESRGFRYQRKQSGEFKRINGILSLKILHLTSERRYGHQIVLHINKISHPSFPSLRRYLLAAMTFVGQIFFLKLLRFNKRIGFLSATMRKCWDDLAG